MNSKYPIPSHDPYTGEKNPYYEEENHCKSIPIKNEITIDIPFNGKHIRFENLTTEQSAVIIQLYESYETKGNRKSASLTQKNIVLDDGIPFPPKSLKLRDGQEIKTWMDGWEACSDEFKNQEFVPWEDVLYNFFRPYVSNDDLYDANQEIDKLYNITITKK